MEDPGSEQEASLRPLWGLIVPIGSLIVILLSYFLLSAAHGNRFCLLHWSPSSLFYFVVIVVFSVIASSVALGWIDDSKFEKRVRSATDLDAYKTMKLLDAGLAHYANVATSGLFLALLLYAGRHFASHFPGGVAVLTALILLVILCIYGVLYSKLALGLAKRPWHRFPYVLSCLFVLALDTLAMYFFLAGASSAPLVGS